MSTMSASDAAPLPRLGEVFFDVRGSSRSMRLSWYADTGVSVFSIWQGGTCTGTFRLPMEELPRLVDALQRGMPGADPLDPRGPGANLNQLPGAPTDPRLTALPGYAGVRDLDFTGPVTGDFRALRPEDQTGTMVFNPPSARGPRALPPARAALPPARPPRRHPRPPCPRRRQGARSISGTTPRSIRSSTGRAGVGCPPPARPTPIRPAIRKYCPGETTATRASIPGRRSTRNKPSTKSPSTKSPSTKSRASTPSRPSTRSCRHTPHPARPMAGSGTRSRVTAPSQASVMTIAPTPARNPASMDTHTPTGGGPARSTGARSTGSNTASRAMASPATAAREPASRGTVGPRTRVKPSPGRATGATPYPGTPSLRILRPPTLSPPTPSLRRLLLPTPDLLTLGLPTLGLRTPSGRTPASSMAAGLIPATATTVPATATTVPARATTGAPPARFMTAGPTRAAGTTIAAMPGRSTRNRAIKGRVTASTITRPREPQRERDTAVTGTPSR